MKKLSKNEILLCAYLLGIVIGIGIGFFIAQQINCAGIVEQCNERLRNAAECGFFINLSG